MTRLAPTLLVLAAIAGGCTKNMESVEVVGVCSLPDSCAFSGGCDQFVLSRPIIDVSLTNSLQLYVEMQNRMADNTNQNTGGLNSKDAYVHEISVSYDNLTSGASLGGSSSGVLATVKASSTSVAKFYVVNETAGTALQTLGVPAWDPTAQNFWDFVGHVTVKGTLQDQTNFETAAFEVPFRVCNGCLLPCANGASCPPNNDGQMPRICASAAP